MVFLFLPLEALILVGLGKNVQFLRHFQSGQFATYPVAQGLVLHLPVFDMFSESLSL